MSYYLYNYEWFKKGFDEYNPSLETILKIKNVLNSYSIELIIDSNYKDVQYIIPKFVKTLYLCEVYTYKIFNIDIHTLPSEINKNVKQIEKVPTIIFKKNEKEHFRITEKPIYCSTIENEIEFILAKNNYQLN